MRFIISKNQSALILKKLITNDIMIAHELHYIIKHNTKGRVGTMAIRLDMSKVYNRVEWP